MTEADKKNYVMAASCSHEHASLVTGHAYTLLGTVKLTGGPQLVHLRNPWGSENYNGPFSDKDSHWTDAWKKEAGWVDADDGKFFIPLEDFKIAFTSYVVLMYQDWTISKHEVNKSGKVFKFTVSSPVDQEVVLTLDYEIPRHIPDDCSKPDLFFNMYWEDDKAVPVSTQTSYGMTKVKMTAGKQHSL